MYLTEYVNLGYNFGFYSLMVLINLFLILGHVIKFKKYNKQT